MIRLFDKSLNFIFLFFVPSCLSGGTFTSIDITKTRKTENTKRNDIFHIV